MSEPDYKHEPASILRDIAFGEPNEAVILEIGRFIYRFSYLEYMIRVLVSDSLRLETTQFDTVTSNYDFRSLCAVVRDLLLSDRKRNLLAFHGDEEYDRRVKAFIKSCLEINDLRVKVAHGTWTTGAELGTYHGKS